MFEFNQISIQEIDFLKPKNNLEISVDYNGNSSRCSSHSNLLDSDSIGLMSDWTTPSKSEISLGKLCKPNVVNPAQVSPSLFKKGPLTTEEESIKTEKKELRSFHFNFEEIKTPILVERNNISNLVESQYTNNQGKSGA